MLKYKYDKEEGRELIGWLYEPPTSKCVRDDGRWGRGKCVYLINNCWREEGSADIGFSERCSIDKWVRKGGREGRECGKGPNKLRWDKERGREGIGAIVCEHKIVSS